MGPPPMAELTATARSSALLRRPKLPFAEIESAPDDACTGDVRHLTGIGGLSALGISHLGEMDVVSRYKLLSDQ